MSFDDYLEAALHPGAQAAALAAASQAAAGEGVGPEAESPTSGPGSQVLQHEEFSPEAWKVGMGG